MRLPSFENTALARRGFLKNLLAIPAALMLAHTSVPALADEANTTGLAVTDDTVKVGILHSVTGTMAISETGSVQAEKLAIEQINAMGGVLGRKIEYIQEDGASDWPTFAEKSKKLLVQDKVAAVFGCWTSVSRKSVLPVFELIQKHGAVDDAEMHQVFNMGIGMTAIVSGPKADGILRSIRRRGFGAWVIGEVTKGRGKVRLAS